MANATTLVATGLAGANGVRSVVEGSSATLTGAGATQGAQGAMDMLSQGAQTVASSRDAVNGTMTVLEKGGKVAQEFNTASGVLSKAKPVMELVEKALPVIERLEVPVAVAVGTVMTAQKLADGDTRGAAQSAAGTGGAVAGIVYGAQAGAVLGSFVPGVGNAAGAVIGGAVGGIAASAAGQYIGGWIHDGVVSLSNAFNQAAPGTAPAPQPAMAAQAAPAAPRRGAPEV